MEPGLPVSRPKLWTCLNWSDPMTKQLIIPFVALIGICLALQLAALALL